MKPTRAATRAALHGLALAIAAFATFALPLFFTAAFAPAIQRELDFSDSRIGVAIAAFWVAATLSSSVSGAFVDRIGRARSTRLAGAFVGAWLTGTPR